MSTYIWIGSHDNDVIHFVWPFKASPMGLPVFGSHNHTCDKILWGFKKRWSGSICTCPSCPPVANFLSIASHSTQSTQSLWPESTCEGVSLLRSHRPAFVLPDPVASRHPVGENEAQRIGDVWPKIKIKCVRNLLSVQWNNKITDQRAWRSILLPDECEKHSGANNVWW